MDSSEQNESSVGSVRSHPPAADGGPSTTHQQVMQSLEEGEKLQAQLEHMTFVPVTMTSAPSSQSNVTSVGASMSQASGGASGNSSGHGQHQHPQAQGGKSGAGGSNNRADDDDELYRNLIVNYVPTAATELEMRQLFAQFGEVESCRLINDKATGLHKGYGFVKYGSPDSAKKAIQDVNGLSLYNKRLKVSFAKQPGLLPGMAPIPTNVMTGLGNTNPQQQAAIVAAAAAAAANTSGSPNEASVQHQQQQQSQQQQMTPVFGVPQPVAQPFQLAQPQLFSQQNQQVFMQTLGMQQQQQPLMFQPLQTASPMQSQQQAQVQHHHQQPGSGSGQSQQIMYVPVLVDGNAGSGSAQQQQPTSGSQSYSGLPSNAVPMSSPLVLHQMPMNAAVGQQDRFAGSGSGFGSSTSSQGSSHFAGQPQQQQVIYGTAGTQYLQPTS